MTFWLLLLMLTACAASPQDMTGKMFTFPEETEIANVKLVTSVQYLTAITVCLRFNTNLSRNHVLFSLATPIYSNGFLIFKDNTSDVIMVYVKNKGAQFGGQDYKLNTWHSICTTWDVANGLVQLWFDGNSTGEKYIGGIKLYIPMIFIGQDQDTYGGHFEKSQSFVGMICDVHVWNHTLPLSEIMHFTFNSSFTPGDVVSWTALNYEQSTKVLTMDTNTVPNENS